MLFASLRCEFLLVVTVFLLLQPSCNAATLEDGASWNNVHQTVGKIALLRHESLSQIAASANAEKVDIVGNVNLTLDKSSPNYVLGTAGRCPGGSQRIFNAEECEAAAKAVHFAAPNLHRTAQKSATVPCRPAGCSKGDDQSLLFHDGSVGEGDCCGCTILCKESSSGSLGSLCPADVVLYNPFKSDTLDIYDREGLRSMNIELNPAALETMWVSLAEMVSQLQKSCEGRRAYQRLKQDGMIVSAFGIDFSPVYHKRYASSPELNPIASDPDVMLLRQAYFATRIHKLFFDTDMKHWYHFPAEVPLGLSQKDTHSLASFRKDGFVQVDDWGLDLEKIMRWVTTTQTNSLLEMSNGTAATHAHHPGAFIHSFLDKEEIGLGDDEVSRTAIGRLVRGYLGSDVEYHGSQHFKLLGSATKTSYSNGPWHHDGCGQRVKAFIYLQDVDDHTHPTLIAAGTHRTQWFPTTQYFAGQKGHNKLSEDLVYQKYGPGVKRMTGKKGGGFLFDSNSLHGADMKGFHKDREAVVLEFAAVDHMRNMDRGDRDGSDGSLSGFEDGLCPSGGHPEKAQWDYIHG